jgi:hypothetical protein
LPTATSPRIIGAVGWFARSKDPRWKALLSTGVRCASCATIHRGLADLGMDHPDYWTHPGAPESNAQVTRGTDVLTADFCILKGHFFVRTVLPIPLIGTEQTFAYGVWSSLAEKNFWKYVETFDSGEQDGLGPWFGWFAHNLKGYPDTRDLKCHVHPVSGRMRPRLELEPTDHPLSVESREGIGFDRLLDIFALNGHDLRSGTRT